MNILKSFKSRILINRFYSARSSLTNRITHISEYDRKNILYSSVLDNDEQLKVNYKHKQITKNIIRKKNYENKLKNVNLRPFPLSLKSYDENINEEKHEDRQKNNKTIEIKRNTFSTNKLPTNWLNDYEYFSGDENLESSTKATADPTIPASKIPCNGCGAHLHCADSAIPGFIPSEIFKGRSDLQLKTIICQRCHFLKYYNIALDVTVSPEDYIKTLSAIEDKFALTILIIDLLDFPCSIWPNIQSILGHKRPVFIVGNKVDLLPKDSKGYLNHIEKCLTDAVIKAGLSKLNIKSVSLVSAKTGYGIEELINKLHKIWLYKGDVYLVGCANVGKSSLFNALLKSDYCKVQATDIIEKATTCPWPGTTLQMLKFPILRPSAIRIYQRAQRLFSESSLKKAEETLRRSQLKDTGKIENATLIGHIGRTFKDDKESQDLFSMPSGTNPILTLDENRKDLKESKWCYDTPGVINTEQIHNLLTTEELLLLNPMEMITPRVFRIKKNMSVFLAGLGRFDYIDGHLDYIKITVYSSMKLPILISNTNNADELYEQFLGTDLFAIPTGDEERLKKWPHLQSHGEIEIRGEDMNLQSFDILLSSTGWIGINLSNGCSCILKAWTPEGRGINVRSPSLIPYGEKLCGQRIRGSLAYNLGKPHIKE